MILLIPLIWRDGSAAFTGAPRSGLQVLRVLLSTAEVVMFFWAVGYLPLADAMTFYLAGPIYVTAFSALLLKEKVGWRRWSAVLVGFAGVVIALRPSAASFTLPALIALIGSVFFALLMIVTRILRDTSDAVMMTGQFFGSFAFGAVTAPFGWITPTPYDFFLLSAFGAVSIVALFCINRSLKLAPASVVVPYQYTMLDVGDRARLPGVRRCAGSPDDRRLCDHRGVRALHLLARADCGAAGAGISARTVISP